MVQLVQGYGQFLGFFTGGGASRSKGCGSPDCHSTLYRAQTFRVAYGGPQYCVQNILRGKMKKGKHRLKGTPCNRGKVSPLSTSPRERPIMPRGERKECVPLWMRWGVQNCVRELIKDKKCLHFLLRLPTLLQCAKNPQGAH